MRPHSLSGAAAQSSAKPANPACRLNPVAPTDGWTWSQPPYRPRAVPPIFPAAYALTASPGAFLDLPHQHRIPLSWLLENGGPSIRYRVLTELAPAGYASPETIAAAHTAVVESKAALAVVKKQKDTGVWGGNLLGLAASAAQGIKDIGTIPQYRRLLQLGWPRAGRPYKLGDRVLFRLLSRDEDPALLFEFQKTSKSDEAAETWARDIMREAACAALAEAGYADDPRLRVPATRSPTPSRNSSGARSPKSRSSSPAPRSSSIPRPIRRAGIP